MNCDVVILGGGLAGLSLARSLQRNVPRASVVVVAGPPARASHRKLGESLVEISAHYLAHDLDLRAHLEASHVPKLGLRFLNRGPKPTPLAARLEYGVFDPPNSEHGFRGAPVPAWQIDRAVLEAEIRRRIESDHAIVIDESARRVSIDAAASHTVELANGQSLRARWVIDASGGRRVLGRSLGTPAEKLPHRTDTLHFWVDKALDIEELVGDAAFTARMRQPGWRRYSTNHYTGPGYWIWSILLPSGATSLGIMVDPTRESLPLPKNREKLLEWLTLREPELADGIRDLDLGELHYRKGQAYRASRVYSRDRWAVTGDAAMYLDALYSSGIDFIGITNTTITRLIATDLDAPSRDAADRSLGAATALSELLFRRLIDGYVAQYRTAYELFGDPARMAQKAIWDSAFYFGIHALLFMNGALSDPMLLPRWKTELDEVYRLHHKAQHILRTSDAPWPRDGYIPHGRVEILRDTYGRLLDRPENEEALGKMLRDNVSRLTAHLRALSDGATSEGATSEGATSEGATSESATSTVAAP